MVETQGTIFVNKFIENDPLKKKENFFCRTVETLVLTVDNDTLVDNGPEKNMSPLLSPPLPECCFGCYFRLFVFWG